MACIHGDSNRYLQILLNFLSNAVKFTPKLGEISVEIRILETQDTQVGKESPEANPKVEQLGFEMISKIDKSN